METYDVILVLGRGIREDGTIPDSAKATTAKAVELYKLGVAPRIIFSGKWTYTLTTAPPMTEAQAMANYARSLGLPDEAIYLEEQSHSTVSNCYYVKTIVLEPNGWKRVMLINLQQGDIRALYNLEYVLGPDYVCAVTSADYYFPEEKQKQIEAIEKKKMVVVRQFLGQFNRGDHEALYAAAQKDLQENYIGKNT